MKNIVPTFDSFLNESQKIKTVADVIKILGKFGKANQDDVLKFIDKNDFNDDFIADIYGYYHIDGSENKK